MTGPVSDEVEGLLADMPSPDETAAAAVRDRANQVLRPTGALARMDEVAVWLAGWQRTPRPHAEAPAVAVFVADHGVAAEGVSAFPAEVTNAMLRALRDGVATASVMARTIGASITVHDVGVGAPSGNLLREPALDEERFHRCLEAGRRAVAELETDLLVLGEIGIAQHHPGRGRLRGPVRWSRRGVDRAGNWHRRGDLRPQGCGRGCGPQAGRRCHRSDRCPVSTGRPGARGHGRRDHRGKTTFDPRAHGWLRGHGGGGPARRCSPRRPGPLPGRALLGGARPPPPPREAGQDSSPRSGPAPGGGERCPGRRPLGEARCGLRDGRGHLRGVGPPKVRGLRAAAAFLTRIPLTAAAVDRDDLKRSVPFFPLVGGLLGLAVAGVYAAARTILPSFGAAALAIGAGVGLTGGLHEDGLGDTADAFGGRSREEALGILKDPAHGTYGVLAISLGLLLRVGALSGLDGWSALSVLPAAHALSRGATMVLLGAMKPATVEGLWVAPACLLAAGAAWAMGRVALRKIGGLTGDVLGAAQQAAEILILLLGGAVVTRGWPGLPWWR